MLQEYLKLNKNIIIVKLYIIFNIFIINIYSIPTIVAECNKLLTGVGPSIASINHIDIIDMADFVIAVNIIKIPIITILL